MWMTEPYKIVLFGHHNFSDHKILDEKLYPLLKDLLRIHAYVEIYIGRDGEFDIYAATIVKNVQKVMDTSNSEFICVLPYIKKDIEYYEKYYDSIIIPDCVRSVHPKGAITKRNRWMVEQADFLICYVEHENGGAYSALKYAKKLKKKRINLAKDDRI